MLITSRGARALSRSYVGDGVGPLLAPSGPLRDNTVGAPRERRRAAPAPHDLSDPETPARPSPAPAVTPARAHPAAAAAPRASVAAEPLAPLASRSVAERRLAMTRADAATGTAAAAAATAAAPRACANTVQGAELLTDSDGYTCARAALDAARPGCCARGDGGGAAAGPARFSCAGCDLSRGCCAAYELCVACCMDPARERARAALRGAASHEAYRNATGAFDLCAYKCRTGSGSIFQQNSCRDASVAARRRG